MMAKQIITAARLHALLPVLLLLGIAAAIPGFAQGQEKEPFKPKIRGAIMMANTHVPNATEGGKKVSIIPTWGFDVDYYFHRRWSVAIQGDIELQSFEVEDNNVEVERSFPFAVAAVIHYHALRHWSFYLGPGYEFESHKSFFLIKTGTEYSFEITEDFEIALSLAHENKEDVYDSWTFGVAFNKRLWSGK
ncbi:MAG TPA: hypothetical protein VK658_07505 [Chryseolinea sp.]|nr:hypothetical protein [Chryseolinea sp.]